MFLTIINCCLNAYYVLLQTYDMEKFSMTKKVMKKATYIQLRSKYVQYSDIKSGVIGTFRQWQGTSGSNLLIEKVFVLPSKYVYNCVRTFTSKHILLI